MNNLKIFIVDDHKSFLKSVAGYIEEAQPFVLLGTVTSGEEALRVIPQLMPDLVLMDISLSGMNGISSAFKIKTRMENPPKVIIMSFYDNHFYRQLAKAVKADEFIEKSNIYNKLIPVIKKLYPSLRKKKLGEFS